MPRAKRGNKRLEKRKKILALAKGYRGTKSKLYRSAKESVERALNFAYTGRKLKKRDFRKLWIVRINGACRLNDIVSTSSRDILSRGTIFSCVSPNAYYHVLL